MAPRSSTASRALITGLRATITVSYRPLTSVVARLDTTSTPWALHLDSGSPAQDHCWAMIDVLRILTLGVQAAESARHAPMLRLVRPGGSDSPTVPAAAPGSPSRAPGSGLSSCPS
jgi:hypothetical protein